jgi:fatty-acyl-CoA synthase
MSSTDLARERTENLHELVTYWASRFADRPVAICRGKVQTWGELDRGSDEIAAGLIAEGMAHGDAVGILMRNSFEFIECMFGAFKAGAAVVLLNVRYTMVEMTHQIIDSRLKIVLSDEEFLPKVDPKVIGERGIKLFANEAVENIRRVAELKTFGTLTERIPVHRDDVALICYTSGTTGVPKGALLTHGNVYATAVGKCLAVGQTYRDRLLLPMPLAYTGGCVALLRDGIAPGAITYLEPDSDADRFLALIETERITALVGPAPLFEKMMAHPSFDTADLSSLTHAVTGGTTVTSHLLQTWMDRGVSITQGYGSTEAGGAFVTILFPEDAIRKWGSAGQKLMHLDLKVVGPDGTELGPNEAGELLIRGAVVMKGYLGRPEATAETLAGGWLHSGDVATIDEEGFVRIVDRVKDMLISGGLNVYPAEIERVIGSVAGLVDFAVLGVPDERWGEVPMIVTACLDGVDLDELNSVCRENLADYKRPRYIVEHHEPLPRTYSTKIRKSHLRERYRTVPAHAIDLKAYAR